MDMDKFLYGVDVGGTTVKLGLFSLSGNLLTRWEIPTRTEDGGACVLPDTAAALLAPPGFPAVRPEQIAGVGIGVPGPVDADNIVYGCVNLGWGTVDLPRALGELLPRLGGPVRAANDANLAALGEQWRGSGRGHESAAMVTLGTGIGCGVVMDGKILPGANGGAGEVGHFFVNEREDECCSCGKRGCLEQYASASGVVRLARRALDGPEPSDLRGLDSFTARDVFDLARAGDALCLRVAERCGDYLGRALSYLACCVDPEIFILGGGMSRAGDTLLAPVRESYRAHAFHVSTDTPIVLAALGGDAGIYGGARLAMG